LPNGTVIAFKIIKRTDDHADKAKAGIFLNQHGWSNRPVATTEDENRCCVFMGIWGCIFMVNYAIGKDK